MFSSVSDGSALADQDDDDFDDYDDDDDEKRVRTTTRSIASHRDSIAVSKGGSIL